MLFRSRYSDLAPNDPDYRLLPEAPEVETAVLRQSAPTRFGEKYSADLATRDTVHLWLWTTATRVSTEADGGEWVETQTLDGQTRRFAARAVVLAGGAIEATRLLMWSNVQNQTSAGDGGGLLGRCYMDHPSGGAAFLHFDKPAGQMVYWSGIDAHADEGVPLHFVLRPSDAALAASGLPNVQFFVFPFADNTADQALARSANRGYRSMRSLAKWLLGRDVGARFDPAEAYCTAVENADELARVQARRLIRREGVSQVLLKYEAEQRPDLENHIALDGQTRDATGVPQPVLTWTPGQDDLEAVRRTALSIGQMAGASGLGRLRLEDHGDDPYWGTSTAWHQLGTMRMADSPTSGVVDADCRVHGAGALYVASGAVFPQVGRANPTLTIVALAVRLADHLKERGV